MRLFASGSEWWGHSLAVVKGGGSFASGSERGGFIRCSGSERGGWSFASGSEGSPIHQ